MPDDDADLVVLCNVEVWADDLREAVLQTWRAAVPAGGPGVPR